MQKTLSETNFKFKGQTNFYRGKVRDVYTINEDTLIIISSDRISAFDVVLEEAIFGKGQILNDIAVDFMRQTSDIVPNWIQKTPHKNVCIGKACQPLKVEMVIRGYLSGHAARVYQSGQRELCGVKLPEGLKPDDKLPQPIITPTTKADLGSHDQDISKEEILHKGIVKEDIYLQAEDLTKKLFERGTKIAEQKGLILVDTKYEFGIDKNGNLTLIDEIHTPDSSRYFYKNSYIQNKEKSLPQKQLSKEFVRQWLISEGFSGEKNQTQPKMTREILQDISQRYKELYKQLMGHDFVFEPLECLEEIIIKNL